MLLCVYYSKLADVFACNSADHEGNIQTWQSRSISHASGVTSDFLSIVFTARWHSTTMQSTVIAIVGVTVRLSVRPSHADMYQNDSS